MKNKILLIVFAIILIACLSAILVYHAKRSYSKVTGVAMNEEFLLSKPELAFYKLCAKAGSQYAYNKVISYYALGKPDIRAEVYWVSKAAKHDIPWAQYYLGKMYLGSYLYNLDSAEFWLTKAYNNGFIEAKSGIEEVKRIRIKQQASAQADQSK